MRSILSVLALVFLMAALPASAAVETQLILYAGGTDYAIITIDTGNPIPNCVGVCGGLTLSTTGDHKILRAFGTLGQYEIDATGRGDLATAEPTLQNFNQIEAKSTSGAGTLIAVFSDTDYTTLGENFLLAASTVIDTQIDTSTVDFEAYVDAANGLPTFTAPSGPFGNLGSLIDDFQNLTGSSDKASTTAASPIIGSTGSLTTFTRLDFTGAGGIQASFTIANAIPEPGSVVLLGSLMLGTGLVMRRKYAAK